MKKRLRKKLRRGEFDVPIAGIGFRMRAYETREAVLSRFIQHIEEVGLQFGGGGGDLIWSGFIQPAGKNLLIEASQLDRVRAWLMQQDEIATYFVGEPLKSAPIEALLLEDPDYPESRIPEVST